LHNSNKQHLILAKFYINNALFIANRSDKFQTNLLKRKIVTAAFVKSLQNILVSGLCVWRHQQRPEIEAFWGHITKDTV